MNIYETLWMKYETFRIFISRIYRKFVLREKSKLDDPQKRKWIEYHILKNKTAKEREEYETKKQEIDNLIDEHFG